MSLKLEHNIEPLPGYRLVERIGRGGFGEVWKVEAPGGLLKAMKFVYGNVDGSDDESRRADQELKALARVRDVRHPYILNLERFDIVDGQLIIVMELADRTLWDRYKECRSDGREGIPRDELLAYMRETAEALDLMNEQFGLQHLDIKPQNLFLVFNHVKVADFGLIKDLQGTCASITGGVTPVYAAPETFDGRVSRTTDQYSLAIVYQEMLTGKRPFAGTTARQLVLQHMQAQPDLSPLPISDRAAVARALAKKSTDRFPSCRDFVEALSTGRTSCTTPIPDTESLESVIVSAPKQEDDATIIARRRDRESPPGNQPVENPSDDLLEDLPNASPLANQGTVTDEPCDAIAGAIAGLEDSVATHAVSEGETPDPSSIRLQKDGTLFPAVVLGIGGFGGAALRRFRRRLQQHFGMFDPTPHLRLLYLDADERDLKSVTQGDAALGLSEVFPVRLHRAGRYLQRRDFHKRIGRWLPRERLHSIPRDPVPHGTRALGRLAFTDHYQTLRRRLGRELADCRDVQRLRSAMRRTQLTFVAAVPRVYLVVHLAGGTGSGMLIDLAFAVRRVLADAGMERAEVVALLVFPSRSAGPSAWANAYAAITELHHFCSSRQKFAALYGDGDEIVRMNGPCVDRCIFLSTPENTGGGLESAATQAAQWLFIETCTRVRREFDPSPSEQNERRTSYQTAGSFSVIFARRVFLERAANRLCRSIVERWMAKDAGRLVDGVHRWVAQHWAELQFSNDEIIYRFQSKLKETIGRRPEAALREIMAPVFVAGGPGENGSPPEMTISLGNLLKALQATDAFLGVPDGCTPLCGIVSTTVEFHGRVREILEAATEELLTTCEEKIAQLIVRLIERPQFRLAGAEEAIRQFLLIVNESLERQEDLAIELRQKTLDLRERLQQILAEMDRLPRNGSKSSSWMFTFSRRLSPDEQHDKLQQELTELLNAYPKSRLQSLLLDAVGSFFVGLRGMLSDQLREVDYCRDRMRELLGRFTEGEASDMDWCRPIAEVLLPEGCASIDAAADAIAERIDADAALALDERFQDLVTRHFNSLVQVCLGSSSSTVLNNLAPMMRTTAVEFLEDRTPADCAVSAWLKRVDPDHPADAVDELYENACPELTSLEQRDDRCIVAVPEGSQSERFIDLLREVAPSAHVTELKSREEIIVYRERSFTHPGEIHQLVKHGQKAYQQLIRNRMTSPHSRMDIGDWRKPDSE